MDQNFSLMAQSRANYYTAGSPVQFVRVELLKGDTTGEVAVCLTFKNVGTEPLTGLVVHFKCKDAAGQVLSTRHLLPREFLRHSLMEALAVGQLFTPPVRRLG